jgi:Flp pilus assembly protein TadD
LNHKNLPFILALMGGLSGCNSFSLSGRSNVSQETIIKMAESSFIQGDFSHSEKLLKDALSQSPEDSEIHFKLAQVFKRAQDWLNAKDSLETALKFSPDNVKIQWELSKVLIALEKPEEALPFINRVLQMLPADPLPLNAKGVCLDMLGQHTQAQEIYELALKIAPGHKDVRNNLGLSHIFKGDMEKASKIFETLVREMPSPRHRQNLAIAYGLMGEMEKARQSVASDLSSQALENNLEYFRQLKRKYNERWKGFQRTPLSLPMGGGGDSYGNDINLALSPVNPLPAAQPVVAPLGPTDAMGNHEDEDPIGSSHHDEEGHFAPPVPGATPSLPPESTPSSPETCADLYGVLQNPAPVMPMVAPPLPPEGPSVPFAAPQRVVVSDASAGGMAPQQVPQPQEALEAREGPWQLGDEEDHQPQPPVINLGR